MSVYGISALAWDLEHVPGLLDLFTSSEPDVLSRYPLDAEEVAAIGRRDAGWLLSHGVNPVVLRNLMVIQGVAHREMYT